MIKISNNALNEGDGSSNLFEEWGTTVSFEKSDINKGDIQRSISNLTNRNIRRKNLTKDYYRKNGKYPLSLVEDAYGSFENALQGTQDASIEEIIQDIKKIARKLDRTPTQREYLEQGKFSTKSIRKKLDSWNNAVDLAGLEFNKCQHDYNISDEDIIQDLRKVAEDVEGSMSVPFYKKQGKYDPRTILRHFDSWNKAKKEAGLKIYEKKELNKEDVEESIRECAEKVDGRLKISEFEEISEFSLFHVRKYYGSWNKAKKELELKICHSSNSGKKYTDKQLIDDLTDLAEKLGSTPTAKQVSDSDITACFATYYRSFGSFNKALEKADLEVNRKRYELEGEKQ